MSEHEFEGAFCINCGADEASSFAEGPCEEATTFGEGPETGALVSTAALPNSDLSPTAAARSTASDRTSTGIGSA